MARAAVIVCGTLTPVLATHLSSLNSPAPSCLPGPLSSPSHQQAQQQQRQQQQQDQQQVEAARRYSGGLQPGSFDYVLLDPPCSALGLRPRLLHDITLHQLRKVCAC